MNKNIKKNFFVTFFLSFFLFAFYTNVSSSTNTEEFNNWLVGFKKAALDKGISNETINVAFKNVKFLNSIKQACYKSDLIVIHTEWNEFKSLNFKKLVNKKNFVIYDLRNIYSTEKMKKLNIKYFGIGR